jgi:hypothetical protein
MKMKDYSNYHNTNSNSKLVSDGQLIFEHSLSGYEGKDVLIDGVSKRVIIQEKYSSLEDGNIKNILGKVADIEKGQTVVFDGNNYITVTMPEDNGIYRKAVIKLCNQTLTLKGTVTQVNTGEKDWRRDPIYETTEESTILVPCIVESKIYYNSTTEAINLPDGHVKVTIPFTEHEDIKMNGEIILYDETYQITDIDRTQSLDKSGILILSAKRT